MWIEMVIAVVAQLQYQHLELRVLFLHYHVFIQKDTPPEVQHMLIIKFPDATKCRRVVENVVKLFIDFIDYFHKGGGGGAPFMQT